MNIELKDIHFSYGPIKALDGIDLSIGEGACGLLGPNGAGKSTLLRILLGFLRPGRGEGRILGRDILHDQFAIRRLVGYMPEDDCLIPGLDAVTFTAYFGELSGMPRQEAMKRAHDVLFYVGLGEARYRLLETYSAGMKQRIKLAQALVHDPKLLFLDEPTSNLDPQGRREVLELIKDISSKKDIQVLISSHILSDIEFTCSNVVILNKGKIAAQGEIQALKQVDYSLYEMKIKGEAGPLSGTCGRAAAGSKRPRRASSRFICRRICAGTAYSGSPPARTSRSVISSGARPRSRISSPRPWGWTDAHFGTRLSTLAGDARRAAPAVGPHHPPGHQAGLQAQVLQIRAGALASPRPHLFGRRVHLRENRGFQFMIRGRNRLLTVDPAYFKTYFTGDFLLFMMVMIMVLAGAGLIADDLKHNSLQLYFARPLRKRDYLMGKMGVVSFFLLLQTLLPGLFFFLLKLVFSGSFKFLTQYPGIPLAVVLDSLLLTAFFGLYTLFLSSLGRNRRFASILLFLVYFFSDIFFGVFYGIFRLPAFCLLSIKANLQQVGAALFGVPGPYEVPWIYSALVLAALSGAAVFVLLRKINSVEVIR